LQHLSQPDAKPRSDELLSPKILAPSIDVNDVKAEAYVAGVDVDGRAPGRLRIFFSNLMPSQLVWIVEYPVLSVAA
jgi:hypothetical protein